MNVDRGYLNLVAHLNAQSSSLPLETLNASIAHYLAHAQPTATPLAANVVASPRFSAPFSFPSLEGLSTAFRHAVHIKIKAVNDEPGGIFSRGLTTRVAEWVSQVLKGLQGGHPVLRLACYSGLLQGLTDREKELKIQQSSTRRRVEEELVISLAEIIDFVSPAADAWEAEFRSQSRDIKDFLPATLALASRTLPLVASERLKALPLATLSRLLQLSIVDAFQQGAFVSQSLGPLRACDGDKLHIPKECPFARNVDQLLSSLLVSQMASLSAMFAQIISVIADYRPSEAWPVISELSFALHGLAKTVDEGWRLNPLSDIEHEESLTPETQLVATSLWTILKTLLFTTIRLVDRVLNIIVFIPQPSSYSSTNPPVLTPFDLTRISLRTLSHLSFVLPRFGGVSSAASSALPELLKTFYTALDVISSDPAESHKFVTEACAEVAHIRAAAGSKQNIREAKEAYALAVVEQLVPVLHDRTIRDEVYPLCEPHLNDPTHRETYESAHSVMLAVFSAHAKAQKAGTTPSSEPHTIAFAEQIVPAYARCLIANSAPDKLNTAQLCMAYRALVGCASVFGGSRVAASPSEAASTDPSVPEGDAYAWFCIDLLLSTIRAVTPRDDAGREHQRKLLLALVATVSAVSLKILPRLLNELEAIIEMTSKLDEDKAGDHEDESESREEIVKALFEEVLSVGDEEKELAIRWWSDWKVRSRGKGGESFEVYTGKGKDKEFVARL